MLSAILILLPFVLLTTLREKDFPHFFNVSKVWAWIILLGVGIIPKPVSKPELKQGGQYIFCPNHTSMIDILHVLVLVHTPFKFIGKKELAKIPIFGYFYKRTNILVDRSSTGSRKESLRRASQTLDQGIGLCIFPEGGVPEEEWRLAPFKRGAFKLSEEFGIPILPITFVDNKRRFPYAAFRGSPGAIRAIVHESISPEGRTQYELKDEVYNLIDRTLEQYDHRGKTAHEH